MGRKFKVKIVFNRNIAGWCFFSLSAVPSISVIGPRILPSMKGLQFNCTWAQSKWWSQNIGSFICCFMQGFEVEFWTDLHDKEHARCLHLWWQLRVRESEHAADLKKQRTFHRTGNVKKFLMQVISSRILKNKIFCTVTLIFVLNNLLCGKNFYLMFGYLSDTLCCFTIRFVWW